MSEPITEQQIRKFVEAWYLALDRHVSPEEGYTFVADKGLNIHFPDGDLVDFPSFKKWWDRVTNLFFDENHNVHTVDSKISGDRAELRVVVAWQASWFENP